MVGLGYVGLPLAVALAQHYRVIGFDVNVERVMGLQAGDDRTGEISRDILLKSSVTLTSDTADLGSVDVFIVAVPTPVDDHNKPDLAALKSASNLAPICSPPVKACLIMINYLNLKQKMILKNS